MKAFTIPLVLFSMLAIGMLYKKFAYEGAMGEILTIMTALLMAVYLVMLPVCRYESKVFILKYEAQKQTIKEIRNMGDSFERAALIRDLVVINAKLASNQYWADGVWEWFYVPEIKTLKPLK